MNFLFVVVVVSSLLPIQVDFFYSETCGHCRDYFDEVRAIEEHLPVRWVDVSANESYFREYRSYVENYSVVFPFFVIKSGPDVTIVRASEATTENLQNALNFYLENDIVLKEEEEEFDGSLIIFIILIALFIVVIIDRKQKK